MKQKLKNIIKGLIKTQKNFIEVMKKTKRVLVRKFSTILVNTRDVAKIDLCCGPMKIPGYYGVDFTTNVDLKLNLMTNDLPIKDNSIDVVICMSAINYFPRKRAQEIINEVHRVLKPNGITRFGTQDLEKLAKYYINKDMNFFGQKLSNGSDRFEGETIGDKLNAWFYGYVIKGNPCHYVYDYESLALLFTRAGFSMVEKKNYLESRLEDIDKIDNRPDQMFYLEAIK